MSLNSNQFSQTPVVGMLDLRTNPNPSLFSLRYNPGDTSTNRIVPGEGVKLVDLGASDVNGVPVVGKRAADADAIMGVRVFNPEKNQKEPGDIMEIACQGAVVYMEAAAAANRGTEVALTLATAGRVQARTTEELLGIQLDKSAALGDLVRVLITARGFAELPYYEQST